MLILFQDNCPNLQTLDLSNVMTVGRDCVLINIERLQKGCTNMKTLRLTNSMVRLAQTSLSEQVCISFTNTNQHLFYIFLTFLSCCHEFHFIFWS